MPDTSGHAFDNLGRILSAGGEVPGIRLAASGSGIPALVAFFAGRYSALSPADHLVLAELSTRAASNQQRLERGGESSIADIDSVPVNTELYGLQPDGRRVRAIVDVTRTDPQTGETSSIAANLDFATMPNLDEMFESVADLIDRIQDSDPTRVDETEIDDIESIAIEIIGIERRY